MVKLCATVLLMVLAQASSFMPTTNRLTGTVRCYGLFDGFGKKDESWKEEQYQAQQAILKKRRANAGFISEEELQEIEERRKNVGKEERFLQEMQSRPDRGAVLEDWKKVVFYIFVAVPRCTRRLFCRIT